jgi:hypothetical protein
MTLTITLEVRERATSRRDLGEQTDLLLARIAGRDKFEPSVAEKLNTKAGLRTLWQRTPITSNRSSPKDVLLALRYFGITGWSSKVSCK